MALCMLCEASLIGHSAFLFAKKNKKFRAGTLMVAAFPVWPSWGGGGKLHSKLWIGTHVNATGF